MEVRVSNISKFFSYNAIIKNFTFTFESGEFYGIKGRNGSGKSTLMKILSGYLSPSEGKILFTHEDKEISRSHIHKFVSFTGPYIDLTLEFSLKEMYEHVRIFRPLQLDLTYHEFLEFLELKETGDKKIGLFSSGMRQKVSVGLALLDQSPLLLMDEPGSYLDAEAKDWLQGSLQRLRTSRTIIIASNDVDDFASCTHFLQIEEGRVLVTSS